MAFWTVTVTDVQCDTFTSIVSSFRQGIDLLSEFKFPYDEGDPQEWFEFAASTGPTDVYSISGEHVHIQYHDNLELRYAGVKLAPHELV